MLLLSLLLLLPLLLLQKETASIGMTEKQANTPNTSPYKFMCYIDRCVVICIYTYITVSLNRHLYPLSAENLIFRRSDLVGCIIAAHQQ